ncbi:MAG: glycosyltransferase family 2 protein, partial [Actinobacteria bacterium]|nr:glycosyltransferase family 2 protein [Actinomycetota bacterium]
KMLYIKVKFSGGSILIVIQCLYMVNSENPDLSIVILNYNVKDLLLNCLKSIFESKGKLDRWQVIVVDNASSDGSVEAVKEKYKVKIATDSSSPRNDMMVELVENKENLGFAAGNNEGVKFAKAPVILFLNPDTVVGKDTIQKSLEVLLSNPDFGALGCKVELPDGRMDYSCHRGFPTPWNSLAYFSGLAKKFPRSSLFSGYTASYLDINKPHEVDCISGVFLMVRKITGESIGFWDKDYFFNGEDIEFCYSLKQKGWKIYYYPDVKIVHYKGSSSGLWSTSALKVEKHTKIAAATHAASAMRIFYKKHYYKDYPPLLRHFILWAIKLLEHYRKFKILTGLRYE